MEQKKIISYKGWSIRRDHARRWVLLNAPCAPVSTPTLRQAKKVIDGHVAAGRVPISSRNSDTSSLGCPHGKPMCEECRAAARKLTERFNKLLGGEIA